MGIKNPSLSTRVTHNITFQTPREVVDGSILPTSKPASPNVSLTVQSGDFADIDVPFDYVNWMAYVYIGISNLSGSSHTAQVSAEVDGVEVDATSASISDSYAHTFMLQHPEAAVGEVIDFYAHDIDGALELESYGIVLVPIRFGIAPDKILRNMEVLNFATIPPFNGASGFSSSTIGGYYAFHMNGFQFVHSNNDSDRVHPAWFSKGGSIDWEGYYGGVTGYGDDISVKSTSLETIIPFYNANRIPTKISYDILNTRKGD
jgi:hypothetical protein